MRWNWTPGPIRGGLFLALLVVGCASTRSAQGIVIRDDVDDAQYTAEAAKEAYATAGVLQGGSVLCTGTLIHPEWVVTAAHCIPNPETTNFRFSLGSATTALDLTVPAESWVRHPSYSGSNLGQGVDFGLVHLSEPIVDVTPAQLYRGASERFKDVVIVGFGRTGTGITGGTGPSGVKRAAENHVDKLGNASGWSTKALLADFDNPHNPSDSRYGSTTPMALEGNVDSGDSGGPWFQMIEGTEYLTAVTSFKFAFDSSTNADYGDGSAASRVGQELVWLDDNHDVSLFWQGGVSTWGTASEWTESRLPGAVNAAVIDSGMAVIDDVGATADYVFVEGEGRLALAESLTTSYLLLNDGGEVILAPTAAAVTLHGNLRQRGGIIALDIVDGDSETEQGVLTVTGSAEVAGTLAITPDSVSYQDPLSRGEMDTFTLLAASTVSGEYDEVDYSGQSLDLGPNYVGAHDDQADGLFRILTYDERTVTVTNYLAIEGDINGDMRVNELDFNIWNQHRFSTDSNWASGDLNGDSITDGLDFHIWNEHRTESIPGLPSDVTAAAVPEPTSLLAGILGWLLVMLARRQHRC